MRRHTRPGLDDAEMDFLWSRNPSRFFLQGKGRRVGNVRLCPGGMDGPVAICRAPSGVEAEGKGPVRERHTYTV